MQSNVRTRPSRATSHVQGVKATSGGLVKSTLLAAAVAGAILTFVWLPAEYGIDPTGVGEALGLTEMGDIKQQLHAEADADAAIAAAASQAAPLPSASDEIMARLDAIESKLDAIAGTVPVSSGEAQASTAVVEPVVANATTALPDAATATSTKTAAVSASASVSAWRDEAEFTLVPGEGIEIKLVMSEGATAEFEWSANGSVLNYDTHGDGDGQKISYEKGRGVPEQAGQLVAAFAGNHGWFWRNRTDDSVVVTLRTSGDYSEIVGP